jgi:minor extracellular serine protease Vpr
LAFQNYTTMLKTLLLLTFFGSFYSFSQTSFSANTKGDLQVLKSILKENKGVPNEYLEKQYPIYKIQGSYYLSVLCKVTSSFKASAAKQSGILFGSQIKNIVSLKIPVANLDEGLNFPGITYLEIASKINPDLSKAVKDVRADSVQKGFGLPQGYTGKDVLIGITDWGFDYSHPMFYDTSMVASRVLAAWDQYKTSGPSPAGFAYGTEYDTPAELDAAQSDTANIYSYATHGSHVAGIAGGGGAGTEYRGVGFEAQYLFTTFLVDNASVLDAYAWMYQKSVSESKRLVINQSWGLHHIGTLDGNSLLSQALNDYSDLGVVFCSSAGNNGAYNFHIKHVFTGETIKSRINFSQSTPTMWGQSISMWGEVGNSFSSGIQVLNSSNSLLMESSLYSTSSTPNYVDEFMVNGLDTVYFNISADDVHILNNRPQMRLRVRTTNSSLKIILKSTASAGTVHYWNVAELTNNVGNWGSDFTSLGTGYVAGNANYGISEPACTEKVISVAAHASEYYNSAGTTLLGGAIASFSSFGPTLDERVKPDVSAPGSSIGSSISSYTDNSYTLLTSVVFNSRTYPFARFSGTSMSCPMTTGVVTLILQANPNLTAAQVKEILIQTAREDLKTGVIPVEGSLRWGWGKVNAYAAVQLALTTQGLGLNEAAKSVDLLLFPNPTTGMLYISHTSKTAIEQMELVTIDGKKSALKQEISGEIDVTPFPAGMYFLRIVVDGKTVQVPFVKE